MGVALGMAENEKATATLSAAIAFFVMHKTIGTLLSLTGKLEPGAIRKSLLTLDRLDLGVTAPAKGLTLMEVFYDDTLTRKRS